ncbi:putative D-isomer specific 2-hydroxyacid dehydrogenase family protein [Pseudooceanicola batsensis HTCC2597]|uniref:Putative D-isomer specific 2-hydroxyacid dehydrogenase family protein n=1 Tax=Pseudooceanicola batsensis (strain ATCC BAA-863 / DSM 15984 / KCTC 12145 / HTCC2597) TaxID=252305 RepID=A3TYM3_PSEBH|nr:C-terminal binding protein [Pseudooceanicola batsensis]EAQ03257.1 putative D-isomer specific 2-hydroxyacid dehydrogenase family protein [Pseudooceanicola batsensis HTCC2597]
MTKVVAVLEPGYADYATERALLAEHGVEVVAVPESEAAAPALARLDPVAVLLRERPFGAGEIAAAPGLRGVVRYGVGVDNIDLAAAREAGIYVANVPDYGAEHEVSDHAVALYLAVNRRIPARDAEVRSGGWGVGQAAMIPGRRAAVLGLVGYGRIARAAAAKFRALGFVRVLAHDPGVPDAELRREGVTPADPDTICREADVISLHAPLVAGTHHIIDARRIALMKPTTILVNVARGGLVDEPALAAALAEGRIFGAGIDVFEDEPPAPAANPLFEAPNTVLTDHGAWYSEASVERLQTLAAQEVARVLAGQPPENWVNRWPTR